jgi:predicted esterase
VTAEIHVVAATTHGRYRVAPAAGGARGILVGFHGYGETAERHLAELERLPGGERWTRVAVDGLHAFYDRKNESVVRSWMTRDLRDEAIADNVSYVAAVVERVRGAAGWELPLVYCGFSQGASMCWRAAILGGQDTAAAVTIGGDCPPELAEIENFPLRRALLARGAADEWYSEEKLARDEGILAAHRVDVEVLRYPGGHEWTDELRQGIGDFLASLLA